MSDFIDVEGASGANYRFRLMRDLAELPATAGNFLFVRQETGMPPCFPRGGVE